MADSDLVARLREMQDRMRDVDAELYLEAADYIEEQDAVIEVFRDAYAKAIGRPEATVTEAMMHMSNLLLNLRANLGAERRMHAQLRTQLLAAQEADEQ